MYNCSTLTSLRTSFLCEIGSICKEVAYLSGNVVANMNDLMCDPGVLFIYLYMFCWDIIGNTILNNCFKGIIQRNFGAYFLSVRVQRSH